jgi:hypothetical protein
MDPRTVSRERALAATLDRPTLVRESGLRPAPMSVARPAELAVVDQDRLDKLARRINALYREATLDVTYSIGRLVISELYDGSVALWGEQGTRRLSYRKLASRGDLLLSPSALCRSVAIYALCERMGDRNGWRHLTASHLQEVLVLDATHQERLLRAADEENWSVSRLRAEVTKQRPGSARSRRTGVVQAARLLRTFVAKHQAAFEDAEAIRRIDHDLAQELASLVENLKASLGAVEQALATREVRA